MNERPDPELLADDDALIALGREAFRQEAAALETIGAGLDVTDPEPLPSDHPLWVAKNVVITPHIAGRNFDSVQRTLIIARENLRRYVLGEKLLSVVDVERGY